MQQPVGQRNLATAGQERCAPADVERGAEGQDEEGQQGDQPECHVFRVWGFEFRVTLRQPLPHRQNGYQSQQQGREAGEYHPL